MNQNRRHYSLFLLIVLFILWGFELFFLVKRLTFVDCQFDLTVCLIGFELISFAPFSFCIFHLMTKICICSLSIYLLMNRLNQCSGNCFLVAIIIVVYTLLTSALILRFLLASHGTFSYNFQFLTSSRLFHHFTYCIFAIEFIISHPDLVFSLYNLFFSLYIISIYCCNQSHIY